MSAAGTPSTDPWVILAKERARYEEHFKSLKPINGVVTGDQVKGFLLQSQLPPLVLGQIWALADTDADGKMDISEFSIACKLINLKLRGFEVPKALPPGLLASLKVHTPPAIPPLPTATQINPPPRPEPPKVAPVAPAPLIPNLQQQPIPTGIVPPMQSVQPLISGIPTMGPPVGAIPPLMNQPPMMSQQSMMTGVGVGPGVGPPMIPPLPGAAMGMVGVPPISGVVAVPHLSPVGSTTGSVGGPAASGTPRGSVASLDKGATIDSLADWSVSQNTKLKYTQLFNTTDRTRTGFLTGVQARNVMVQTKLPQATLAQIWGLSDMDADGRLGCEEFVLAMHLCEQAAAGVAPPKELPPDLVPPSFRRPTRTVSRTPSISSQPDVDVASSLSQIDTFEDKRKENFEKGQAELERRRKDLLAQQKKEAEERERKEREEIDRREKARQEAERKRMEELEKQMRDQQEKERMIEEERKRQAEQREAARREMERQRQLEWEKQRLQELQHQRQREQESVLKLKAKNQSLTIELSTLNDQVKELSQKICDTRVGVSNVKTTIDGMRSTRDTQMQDMSQLKNKLKEQNAKLLALSQEKAKLDARNKMNSQSMNDNSQTEQTKQAFESKEINIKMLKEKVADMQTEIDGKLNDIENNNSHLADLKSQMSELIRECEGLYGVYEQKKSQVLDLKSTSSTKSYDSAWQSTTATSAVTGGWGDPQEEWPVDSWPTESSQPVHEPGAGHNASMVGAVKYRALYAFEGRNNDEITFQPGDIILVPLEQTGEPGWLAGEIRGQTGWFPESYVEPVEGVGVRGAVIPEPEPSYVEELEAKRLEGIVEVPETIPETFEPVPPVEPIAPVETQETFLPSEEIIEYYIANYPYQSVEQGDLTFSAGEMITVVKKEGDWWTGKVGDRIGIFPSNYVQKVDVSTSANNGFEVVSQPSQDLHASQDNAQMDNEVCQINENKENEKPDFAAMSANSQTLKGNKKPEIASVIAPYQATSTEQLSLQRGQLIMIRKKTDSGWWEGELQAKGRKRQVGWFPASYVKVLNSSGRASGRTTPVSTTRMQQEVVIDKVVALYPYTAANPDELSFLKDDIISVTAREEASWWRGELNGVSGVFPSNYVAPLQQ